MQPAEHVLWRTADGVGRITLNRPDRANAISLAVSQRLSSVLETACDAVAAGTVRVLLIDAAGERFCAGGDIGEFVAQADTMHRLIDDILAPLNPAMHRVATLPVPVISAVNGAIGGAGIGLALCADVVLASEAMKLRAGYSAIGLSPDAGSAWFLSRRVGASKAKELFFFNRVLSAEECLQMGVVDRILPVAELASVAMEMAAQAAAAPVGSMTAIKRLCDGAATRALREHLALEKEFLLACSRTADAREGVGAFAQKRAPRFGRGGA